MTTATVTQRRLDHHVKNKSKSEKLIKGVNRKKMQKIEGKLICFKRAESWDYNEVVEQRTKINNFGECNSG